MYITLGIILLLLLIFIFYKILKMLRIWKTADRLTPDQTKKLIDLGRRLKDE